MTHRGHRKGSMLRISVQFDDETFAAIAAAAERGGVSFAEQVRIFCEWGLDTVNDRNAPPLRATGPIRQPAKLSTDTLTC